jgi:hypothetical protein
VLAILRRALQRDPAHRFTSAGEMGEACEHFLYDKGYGPTNLTLKHYVNVLFPGAVVTETDPSERFPPVEATLIPIGDARSPRRRKATDGATRVSAISSAYTRVVKQAPPPPGPDALEAPSGEAPEKTRSRRPKAPPGA